MEKKVTVLTPNGRRQNVKVTPNTTLLQILEEVCLKHGFDSDEYCLKHHNKEVGLTQIFRFSGLPNNCMLEMSLAEKKRVESIVDICVQLEDGSRQQGQFLPTDNLWDVVENLSASALATYDSPVAIYMRQEIIGKDSMSRTSLKSLGITAGRAMIRVINKNPEDLKTQANVYIAPAAREITKEDNVLPRSSTSLKNSQGIGGGGFAITKDLMQSLRKTNETESAQATGEHTDLVKEDDESTIREPEKPKYDWGTGSGRTIRSSIDVRELEAVEQDAEMESEPEVHVIGERSAILYSLDATQKQIENLPDSFFDLTVSDLKLVLRDLKNVAAGNENAPLLTQKLRELEESKTMLNKIAQYKNCVIRVQFPDRHVLQGIFKPIDKIANVLDFVRKFIINPDANFYLFTIPPKTVLPLDKTLLELDFVPTAVVHFALFGDDQSTTDSNDGERKFLKPEYLEQLTSVEGAFFAASKMRISNRKPVVPESNNNDNATTSQYESKSPGPSTGAIPKRPRNENFEQPT